MSTADADLVELVEKYTFLYDGKHKNFKNKLMKRNAWVNIAQILDTTGISHQVGPPNAFETVTSSPVKGGGLSQKNRLDLSA